MLFVIVVLLVVPVLGCLVSALLTPTAPKRRGDTVAHRRCRRIGAARTALGIGALPVGFGLLFVVTGVAAAASVSPRGGFAFDGLVRFAFGFLALLFGIGFLARALWLLVSASASPRRRLALGLAGAAAIAALPVGSVVAFAIAPPDRVWVLRVANRADDPMVDVRVFGAGCDVSFGTVAAGCEVVREVSFDDGRALTFVGRFTGHAPKELRRVVVGHADYDFTITSEREVVVDRVDFSD